MLILASGSPRRREILSRLGVPFSVEPADVDESRIEGEAPREYAVRLSLKKAQAVAKTHPDCTVIAADTVVALGSTVFGKPKDEEEALSFLQQLSGKTHEVITGVTVMHGQKSVSVAEVSLVTFRQADKEELLRYIRTQRPFDKAGAYGIQDIGTPVCRCEGDFDNVVGLPYGRLVELLREIQP